MNKLSEIKFKNKLYAIVIRSGFGQEGVNFVTSKKRSLQVGVLVHKKNITLRPHIHRRLTRKLNNTQEVLYVVYGRVEVSFYNVKRKLGSVIIGKNDAIVIISGGHGFNMLEDSKIIEVKQGPYVCSEKDKKFIDLK
ncbi:MAG: hypothetical protein V1674_07580 [Candidatus Omnitrophota bacterium]